MSGIIEDCDELVPAMLQENFQKFSLTEMTGEGRQQGPEYAHLFISPDKCRCYIQLNEAIDES